MGHHADLMFFEEHVGDWIREHEGKYVSIKNNHAVGFFDTKEEAIRAGVEVFGITSFLMRKVERGGSE